MIGMNSWQQNGRVGNCLFQWAFISSLSRKLSVPYLLPKWEHADKFKGKFKTGLVAGRVIKERGYGFHDYTDLNPAEDLDFYGHYQSERYFDDQVKKEIDFTEEYKAEVKAKFSKYFARPTISIGVRRTDYLTLPYYQLGADYYISALEKHFPDWRNYNLVFISDDLEWCRGHFGCVDGAYFPQTKDIEQMCLSSLCDHFIIANSTFHWWGAFMGEKEYSKVVQPTKLFIGSLLEKHGDLNFYSERWVSHEAESIDLSDVTFTIPVYHDSGDRKENLELTVSLLQKHFKTNIIIGEQGSDGLDLGCTEYIKFNLPNFHRTKMLNDMAKASKTPFIANWDCDVFVPPMQILQSVWFLRNGAKMIYPYDDKFCRIMRKYRKMIFPWYDIGAFFSGDYNRDTPSFGGAVMWNKQTYFEIGGENEYFISFGPEDIERMERALALGIKVERVRGRLYHFNHWCGPDSSVSNPYFKTNRGLLEKQRKMSVAELKDYINSWPWHSPYTESYYETIVEDAVRSRDAVFEILGIDRDSNFCDVGGGCGQWGVGLKNYTCIDYRVPLDKLMIDVEQYIDHDLRIPLNLGKYDVVLCLEVAEHIEEQYADIVVENVCNLVKDDGMIIFSAAVISQGGNNHCNEQLQSYWIEKFECRGKSCLMNDKIQNDKRICLWYRQNIMLVVPSHKAKLMLHGGFEMAKDFILPEYYVEIVNHLKSK